MRKKIKTNDIPLLDSDTLQRWVQIISLDDHYPISTEDAQRWTEAYLKYRDWYQIVEEEGVETDLFCVPFRVYCLYQAQKQLRAIEQEIGFQPVPWREIEISL